MIRTCVAVLAGICGLASTASGQVFTSYDSAAYTSYYAPSYGYSAYSYRDGWGPLGLVNWRRPASYWYGGTYTAGYAPSSYYAPATTSYYAPFVDTAVAYYAAPASSGCCVPSCPSCCTPCCASSCGTCSSGNCPGGNCSLNYAPTDMSPRPDASMSSGSRTIENESSGNRNTDGGTNGTDDWRGRPADGYDGTERGASYPPTRIQQKAPTDVNEGAAEAAEESAPEAPRANTNDDAEPEAEDNLEAPGSNPAASLLNLDTRVTAAPRLTRERLSLRARFQSPRLARATIDVKTITATEELRLVQK